MPGAARYVALLRGVNVGGNNIIPMAALRAAVEALGLRDVATYIQSGNVLFTGPAGSRAPRQLESRLQAALSRRFRYTSRVVVVSRSMLARIVAEAPAGFGIAPAAYRYDVIFCKAPLTPAAALRAVETRDGVDAVSAGTYALYFTRLIRRATQSRLSRIVQKPEYQYMTTQLEHHHEAAGASGRRGALDAVYGEAA